MEIVAFDFDGTITTRDTFLEFIKHSKGKPAFYFGFLLYMPLLIAFKLNLYPNWKVKQKIFTHFFKGDSLAQFNIWCKTFAEKINVITRSKALEQIKSDLGKNNTVLIISASVENWIYPWARKYNIKYVIATKIELDINSKLTGKFITPNCYGPEKVNRLLNLFPERNTYRLRAYGDSKGDKQMIEFADEGWYNRFV